MWACEALYNICVAFMHFPLQISWSPHCLVPRPTEFRTISCVCAKCVTIQTTRLEPHVFTSTGVTICFLLVQRNCGPSHVHFNWSHAEKPSNQIQDSMLVSVVVDSRAATTPQNHWFAKDSGDGKTRLAPDVVQNVQRQQCWPIFNSNLFSFYHHAFASGWCHAVLLMTSTTRFGTRDCPTCRQMLETEAWQCTGVCGHHYDVPHHRVSARIFSCISHPLGILTCEWRNGESALGVLRASLGCVCGHPWDVPRHRVQSTRCTCACNGVHHACTP